MSFLSKLLSSRGSVPSPHLSDSAEGNHLATATFQLQGVLEHAYSEKHPKEYGVNKGAHFLFRNLPVHQRQGNKSDCIGITQEGNLYFEIPVGVQFEGVVRDFLNTSNIAGNTRLGERKGSLCNYTTFSLEKVNPDAIQTAYQAIPEPFRTKFEQSADKGRSL